MKKLILILISALLVLPTSCVKDDLDACAGLLHLYFSYIYRETNEFYSTVNTDVHVNYYYKESGENIGKPPSSVRASTSTLPTCGRKHCKTATPSFWYRGHTMSVWIMWNRPAPRRARAMSI